MQWALIVDGKITQVEPDSAEIPFPVVSVWAWRKVDDLASVGDEYDVASDVWIANPGEPLDAVKFRKIDELHGAMNTHLQTQFISNVLGSAHQYDAEIHDQQNLMGLHLAGVDSTYRCRAVNENVKQEVPHTAAQLTSLYNEGLVFVKAALDNYRSKKAQVDAATDAQTVNAITW